MVQKQLNDFVKNQSVVSNFMSSPKLQFEPERDDFLLQLSDFILISKLISRF